MSVKLKNLFLLIGTFILVVSFTPFLGGLYEKIIGRNITSWFIGPAHPEYFEGFFMSYAFFVTLILTLFLTHKKYKTLGIFLGVLLFIDLFIGAWESLIIDVITVIISWLLAQLILLVYKKVKK